jgi:hypothetical protein
MRCRVAKKFGRVPAQHGEMFTPMFFPQALSPGIWGTPWGKVKEAEKPMGYAFGVMMVPFMMWMDSWQNGYILRVANHGIGGFDQSVFGFADLDNPDWEIIWKETQRERSQGLHNIRHGGINYLASYLWKPGDPEPDLRLRLPPEGTH